MTHSQDVLFARPFGGNREGLRTEVVSGMRDDVRREGTPWVIQVDEGPESIAEVVLSGTVFEVASVYPSAVIALSSHVVSTDGVVSIDASTYMVVVAVGA